jgi:hypothetical protein
MPGAAQFYIVTSPYEVSSTGPLRSPYRPLNKESLDHQHGLSLTDGTHLDPRERRSGACIARQSARVVTTRASPATTRAMWS